MAYFIATKTNKHNNVNPLAQKTRTKARRKRNVRNKLAKASRKANW